MHTDFTHSRCGARSGTALINIFALKCGAYSEAALIPVNTVKVSVLNLSLLLLTKRTKTLLFTVFTVSLHP